MQTPENEQPTPETGKVNEAYVDQDFQNDHPGKQEISKNPNPMANENLPETAGEPIKPEDNTSNEVGSEITDGEAG